MKQIDSTLPCICSVIDHRGSQNVLRTSVAHSVAPHVPLFCFYHILTSAFICDSLLNARKATRHLFVQYILFIYFWFLLFLLLFLASSRSQLQREQLLILFWTFLAVADATSNLYDYRLFQLHAVVRKYEP